MSPSINAHLLEALNAASIQLNRYFSLFIFIFGFTGNILNILVLTERSLRSNRCVFLFLMSSITNLISIILGLIPRILSTNLINTPLKCYGKTTACRLLTDIIYSCFTISFPLIPMAVLGVLTLSNIRKRRSSTKTTMEKIDRYLRRMLLLQVISLILLIFPQAIHKVYFTMSSNKNKSQMQYDFDRFLYNFELLLPFIESALPFYIYTLAGGKVFRNALEKLLF
ncbi:unnamed protein product [Rotaria socialis]|uniref:G-protein coupled receptors family 1 profile domain-containing protein n=1 Tax=Rotaria socialis TaxID=392032 RepID=A0A821TEF5_9BILA|nr:unnamed protein product [Rotaria socialis]CAF4445772.1 unnamed protein product [Rotaria socialis]CAF4808191.1 unnamed protein product [Rotaria socialis]CAF4869084.1 unnamed protein product [Rotaria socialis]